MADMASFVTAVIGLSPKATLMLSIGSAGCMSQAMALRVLSKQDVNDDVPYRAPHGLFSQGTSGTQKA
jgi:hypothetical protein